MATPIAPLGGQLFQNFGLMTPDLLARQRQAALQAQFDAAAQDPNVHAGNARMIGMGLGQALGGAIDKHYGRADPEMQQAQGNDQLLHDIFQQVGGDPVAALQMAAQKGIPGAQEQWAKIQQQHATLQNTQSEIDNRAADNTRASSAETRAQATADMETKKNTWETIKDTPDATIQRNGLGQVKVERKTFGADGIGTGGPISPEDKNAFAQAIAKYHQPFPTAGSRGLKATGMSLPELQQRVQEANPKYNASGYNAQMAFSKGAQGDQLQAQDAASFHLQQYMEAMKAYQSGDLVPLNKLAVSLGKNAGDSGPTTLNTIAGVLGPEIAKAIVKAGGGVAERTAKEKTLSAELSDPQKIGNVAAYGGLMYGQRQAVKARYLSSLEGTTEDDFNARFPMPEALKPFAEAHGAGASSKPMPSGAKLAAYATAHFGGDTAKATAYLQGQGYK